MNRKRVFCFPLTPNVPTDKGVEEKQTAPIPLGQSFTFQPSHLLDVTQAHRLPTVSRYMT